MFGKHDWEMREEKLPEEEKSVKKKRTAGGWRRQAVQVETPHRCRRAARVREFEAAIGAWIM